MFFVGRTSSALQLDAPKLLLNLHNLRALSLPKNIYSKTKHIQENWAVSWLLNHQTRLVACPKRLKIKTWMWLFHPDFLNVEQCACHLLNVFYLGCVFLFTHCYVTSFILTASLFQKLLTVATAAISETSLKTDKNEHFLIILCTCAGLMWAALKRRRWWITLLWESEVRADIWEMGGLQQDSGASYETALTY